MGPGDTSRGPRELLGLLKRLAFAQVPPLITSFLGGGLYLPTPGEFLPCVCMPSRVRRLSRVKEAGPFLLSTCTLAS